MVHEETIVSGMTGRYASALYSLAAEKGEATAIRASLASFTAMLDESDDLRRLVRSPMFTSKDQLKALDALFAKTGMSGIAANFIKLLAAKRRLFAVSDIIAGYNKLDDAENGVSRAEVTVAEALSPAQTDALRESLRAVTGGRSVETNVRIDPAIIGGLVVKLGSRMVDGSLRTKLNSLRTRMKEVG